ncbi:TRAP transporter small permease [Marivivens sp. LCG002]|uniref:TRAP transporter small permease n=1 Tax=Marivivens sp. LCG002 TaxID=3051171 RepID=UPI002557B512|nr:TRAP transporter small permease [Marivivens sp. LCG002]WIV51232.1 TRAP transporter small permease [Marivivens sp. LCG002]
MKRFMMGLAHVFALIGGAALSAMILIVCLSIIGRTGATIMHSDFMQTYASGFATWSLEAGLGPVNGDYEIVEALMAFAIFAFIPLTQATSGHATVDILTNALPPVVQRWLAALIEVVFAITLVIIAWKLYDGTVSKHRSGGTTLLLQFPLWWAYAGALVGAVASAIVAVYMGVVRVVEAITDTVIVEAGGGADH